MTKVSSSCFREEDYMKQFKNVLAFVLGGLIVATVWFGYEAVPHDKNLEIEKEPAPVAYEIGQFIDLFVLSGGTREEYLYVDVELRGQLVYKNTETHTIILQDLNNTERHLRASVSESKWAKVKNLSINQAVNVYGYAVRLTYFNEPIIEVRDIGKI